MKPIETYSLMTNQGREIFVSCFGVVPYEDSHRLMVEYATTRGADASDQIWLLEHPAVYTQGTACSLETFVASDIPTVKTDRGGQITYHGPGQIVMYPLLHLKNHGIGVKALVNSLEQCVIDFLKSHQLESERRADAPGVYIDQAKIAALGLRIKRGNSYHGLSFNVDMDLSPFDNISPCGYQGLKITQLLHHNRKLIPVDVGRQLAETFAGLL